MDGTIKSVIEQLQDAHYEILLELNDSMDAIEDLNLIRSGNGEALVERAIEIRDLRIAMEAIVNTINYLELKHR